MVKRFKSISIIFLDSAFRPKPHETIAVLNDDVHIIAGQAVRRSEMSEYEVGFLGIAA